MKLLQTVFILLELCLAFSDHLLHVCGEVGNVFGDLKSEVLCEGTNNAHEPKLCGIEAGELCQRAVTELDVLIEVRHKRLDLLKHCLAFVVSLSVFFDLLLAFFVSLQAFFVSLLAFGVCLLTGCELCCAFVVGCKSVGEGVCAVKVSLLIVLELLYALSCFCDAFPCGVGIAGLILFDVLDVLYAGYAGEQSEYACQNEADATDHK